MTGVVFIVLELATLVLLRHGWLRSGVDLIGALVGGGVCLAVAAKLERPEPAAAALVGVPLGISLAELVTGYRTELVHPDFVAEDGALALAAIGTIVVGFIMIVAAYLEGLSGPWRKSGSNGGRELAMIVSVVLAPVVFYALGVRWS